jgi:hypothetical protein
VKTTTNPWSLAPLTQATVRARAWLAATLGLLLLFGGIAEARNPDLSYWTRNLSEGAGESELQEDDFAPEIVVTGATVHILWITRNADYSGYKLFYRRSLDNGSTWQAKQLLLEHADLDYDNAYKRMAVTGDSVHIAFSYYTGSWYGVLGYLRSNDNGASFEASRNLYIASQAYHHVRDVRVAASGGKLSIGFRDQRNWPIENAYHVLNSDDGGDSFVMRTAYSTASGSSSHAVDLQRYDDAIYVAYTNRDSFYVAASNDAGQTFTSTLVSVPSLNGEHKTYGLQDYHYVPKIAAAGDSVFVTWNGLDEQDRHAVFVRRSTDGGRTFDAAISLTGEGLPDGKAIQGGQETIAALGTNVYAVLASTAGDIYLRRSNDGGASFQPLQTLSSAETPYLGDNAWPVIQVDPGVVDGSRVEVFWSAPSRVSSSDAGANFTRPALVSPYFSYGGTLSSKATAPQMAIGGNGEAHIVHRSRYYSSDFGDYGDFDIFYRRLDEAPAASGSANALHLHSDRDAARRDNLQVPASADINFTSAMTGEIWVRPYADGITTGTTSAVKPVFSKTERDYRVAYALQTRDWYGERQAQARITTSDGEFYVNPDDAIGLVPDDTWSHLAFTYDAGAGSGNLKLYLNGQLVAATTASGELTTGDGLLLVGYYGSWDVTEMRLWDRALTLDELANGRYTALRAGTPGLKAYYRFRDTTRDFSGNGNDGLLMYQETYMQQDFIAELTNIDSVLTIINLLLDE